MKVVLHRSEYRTLNDRGRVSVNGVTVGRWKVERYTYSNWYDAWIAHPDTGARASSKARRQAPQPEADCRMDQEDLHRNGEQT